MQAARGRMVDEHFEEKKELKAQLAKANERVKELEKERDHSQRMYNSLLGDLSNGYGKSSISECEKHLNKFAIEKKIEAIDAAIGYCILKYPNGAIHSLGEFCEQLRKEQDSE